MTDRYAVLGHPIAHSRSPRIHAEFARQTGQDLSYEAIEVAPGGFRQAVEAFAREGGQGLNVTLPFKQEAWALADTRGPAAERAGAVNTLVFVDGRVHGENTDGVGLVRDLVHNHGQAIAGRRVLLIGAGGAARGVLGPLLAEGVARLVVANRTAARAEALARLYRDRGPVRGCGLEALAGERFDLLINATSASLSGKVPPLPPNLLAQGGWCYDMMYADRPTAFVRWGHAQGASGSVDGLGMLVEQAAESFRIWRGVRPETAPVIRLLRGA